MTRYVTERRAVDEAAGRRGPWRREDDVVLYRYTLPNDAPGEGWAIVTLGSDGTFHALSDWGDYAHWWGSIGGDGDLRRFLVGADAGYLLRKLAGGETVYDGEETFKEIRSYLREVARDGDKRADWLREEQERLRDAKKDILADEHGFHAWCDDTQIEEPWTFQQSKPPQQCVAFVERVIPRLQKLLQAELGMDLVPVGVAA